MQLEHNYLKPTIYVILHVTCKHVSFKLKLAELKLELAHLPFALLGYEQQVLEHPQFILLQIAAVVVLADVSERKLTPLKGDLEELPLSVQIDVLVSMLQLCVALIVTVPLIRDDRAAVEDTVVNKVWVLF